MFQHPFKSLLLCAALALGAVAANATVITFDNTEQNHNTEQFAATYGHSVTLDGYTFSSPTLLDSSSFVSSTYTTYTFIPGLQWDNGVLGAYANDGTDFLRVNLTSVTMTSASNTPFTLNSVDLANWIADVPDAVLLTGIRANGTVVTWLDLVLLSNTGGRDDFNTYVTSTFTDLVSLTFTSLGTNLAIDNINVTAGVVTPPPPATNVPEPGTLAIMGLGLAGIVVARRRKRAV